jgi:glutathione S-transferase
MAVKLHRCGTMWLKVDPHPCWRVQKALDQAGIEYEVVTHPRRRGNRTALEAKTGQKALPVIEFEDGEVYRAESKEMAERIRAGKLTPGADASGEATAERSK